MGKINFNFLPDIATVSCKFSGKNFAVLLYSDMQSSVGVYKYSITIASIFH